MSPQWKERLDRWVEQGYIQGYSIPADTPDEIVEQLFDVASPEEAEVPATRHRRKWLGIASIPWWRN